MLNVQCCRGQGNAALGKADMEVDLDALEAETRCPVCLGEFRFHSKVSIGTP